MTTNEKITTGKDNRLASYIDAPQNEMMEIEGVESETEGMKFDNKESCN